jgi:hypothetical protein
MAAYHGSYNLNKMFDMQIGVGLYTNGGSFLGRNATTPMPTNGLLTNFWGVYRNQITTNNNYINVIPAVYGLGFFDASAGGNSLLRFTENTININAPISDGQGIFASNVGLTTTPNTFRLELDHNNITVQRGQTGITLLGSQVWVHDHNGENTLKLLSNIGGINVLGIDVAGGSNNWIDCNEVNGNNATQSFGIRANNSMNNRYRGNVWSNVKDGAQFNGVNSGAQFRCNTFSGSQVQGLTVSGMMGNQFDGPLSTPRTFGNSWSSNFTGTGAVDGFGGNLPTFIVRGFELPPNSIVTNLFSSNAIPQDPNCQVDCNAMFFQNSQKIDGFDREIANGTGLFLSLTESEKRWNQQYLLRKLRTNELLSSNDFELKAFVNDAMSKQIGKSLLLQEATESLLKISDADQTNLDVLSTQVAVYNSNITAMDASITNVSNEAELEVLSAENNNNWTC